MFFHAYPHQYAGAQRVTHSLAKELPVRGLDAFVVLPDDGPFAARLKADDVDVRVVKAPVTWTRYGGALKGRRVLIALAVLPLYWLRMVRTLRRWRPSFVHCNDHRGLLLAGPAARLARVPLVWHVHGTYRSAAINSMGAKLAARILVVSAATLHEMPALTRARGKVEILANGLDLASLKAAPDAGPSPVRRGNPTVVCGARIHPEKGLDVLIEATARLRTRFPEVQVNVVGATQRGYEGHRGELERLRAGLGVEDHVHFLGFVDEPLAAWREATVYVQPSRAEPFGLAVLEAMALGVPVVASRVGGLEEVVEHERSGLQVEPGNAPALAEAIARIASQRDLATRLARAGREEVVRRFSREAMLERLLRSYDEVLGA